MGPPSGGFPPLAGVVFSCTMGARRRFSTDRGHDVERGHVARHDCCMPVSSIRARRAVLDAVDIAGGAVRSARLVAQGHSGYEIARLVDSGALLRVRRRWLVSPGASEAVRFAAAFGVVVTCCTQAERLGLWVLERGRIHVAAPPHGSRRRLPAGVRVHWSPPLVPRDPDTLFDSVENVLASVAACLPFEHALAIWDSALNQGMVDAQALSRLPLRGVARGVLEASTPFADSGLESFIVPRLRWMKLRILSQTWLFGHRVDFLIGERLVLQIDGGSHVDDQRTADITHDAELMLRGYHVIRVGYAQVVGDWPAVQAVIMRAVAQGLHRAR